METENNVTDMPAATPHTQLPEVKKKTAAKTSEVKPERIRAELNIEKWPAIWNPTHSKTRTKIQSQPRTLERENLSPDGNRIVSKVTINPIPQLGDLTTDDQRILYALIKHWEDRGKSDRETPFSIRHLAKLLHKKGWGSNVIDAVTGSLERLRGTLLVWSRSYHSKDERVEDLETVYVNILSKLKIVRRRVDGHVTTEAGYFQFDDHILKNLLDNYTKPFLFDVFIDIKGDIALKLYSYLDLIMADKTRFERCTKDLFDDLGIKGESYRNPSKRKQNLKNALVELTGIMLTTGVLKSATIEKTKDGKDYKVVIHKVSRAEFGQETLEPTTKFASPPQVVINNYTKVKDPLFEQGDQLVKFFHKTIHNVDNHHSQSKEISQAQSLIAQYGVEQANFIIEFAARQAAETGFKIQHFGAVLSYASRALDTLQKSGPAQPVARAAKPLARQSPAQEVQSFPRGEERLLGLTAEQLAVRSEKVRQVLCQENSFLAQHWKPDSRIHQNLVRARLVQELDREDMTLAVFPPRLAALLRQLSQRQNLGVWRVDNLPDAV